MDPFKKMDVKETEPKTVEYLKKYKEELQDKKEEIEQEQKEIDKLLSKNIKMEDNMLPQKNIMTSKETPSLPEEKKEEKPVEVKTIETPTEEEKEGEKPIEASFKIRFKEGETLDKSYFIADDGKELFTVSASEILPLDVIERIKIGKKDEVITPEELIFQLKENGVNSMLTFKNAVIQLKEAALKRTAGVEPLMSMNESEIQKPKEKDQELLMSMKSDEVKSAEKYHPLPSQMKSKVKQYYGRLPSGGGGEIEQSLNPQSSLMAQVELLRTALEEQQKEADKMKEELSKVKKEKEGLEQEKAVDTKSKVLDGIIKDLESKKLIAKEQEDKVIDILSKIDDKVLPHIASLVKEFKGALEKGKPEEMGMGIGMEEPKKLIGKPSELGAKASAKVPPIFISGNTKIESPDEFLAKNWNKPVK